MSDSGQHAEEEWITAEEVAARASCSPEAVRMALESGAFQGEVRDKQCRMTEEAAETFVALVRMLRQEGAQAAVNVYGGQVEKLVQVWQARDVIIEARLEQPVPRQAPRLTEHFVGRGRELERLRKLLLGPEEASIVAVTAVQGMGGVGKSALVSELARDEEIETAFPDGTLWVTLGKTPDVLSVLGGFASAYGYDFSQLTTVAERGREVRSLLHDRQALIVLDDAWDVTHVRPLLVGGPGCKTVMTTRQKQVADGARARLMRLDVLPEDEAITLIAQWLGRELGGEDREKARQLARLVAYLPLAVELAAAQVPEAGWDWVLERLGSVRRLETLELEEAETKWESVRLALELSYEALRDKELKQRFRALGAFAVGATFNAAATAGVWECDENEATDGLRQLARAAMVDRLERGRWRVHDLLMDYALERLVEAGEEAAAWERHARYCLEFAEAHEEDWQAIEAELAQIRAGWRWLGGKARESKARFETAKHYLTVMDTFFERRGLWDENLTWVEVLLTAARQLGIRNSEGQLLNVKGSILGDKGQFSEALCCFGESQALLREANELRALSDTLNNIGGIYVRFGQLDKGVEYLEQAREIDRKTGNPRGEASILNNLAWIYHHRGELGEALANYERARAILEEVGDRANLALALNNIGQVQFQRGELGEALANYERARAIWEEVGDRASLAVALNNIGQVQSQRGELGEALANYERARAIWEEVGDRAHLAVALNNIGEVHRQRGELGEALANFERARAILEEVGDRAGLAGALNNIGQVQFQRGELGEALANFERARAILEEVGDRASLSVTLNNIGQVQFQRGEPGEALANFERARAILEEVGDRANLGLVKASIGLVYQDRNEYQEALRWLREGVALMEAAGGHPQLQSARAALRELEEGRFM